MKKWINHKKYETKCLLYDIIAFVDDALDIIALCGDHKSDKQHGGKIRNGNIYLKKTGNRERKA